MFLLPFTSNQIVLSAIASDIYKILFGQKSAYKINNNKKMLSFTDSHGIYPFIQVHNE